MDNDKNSFEPHVQAPPLPAGATVADAGAGAPDLNKELEILNKVPEKYRNKKMIYAGLAGVFVVGLLLGAMLFGGSAQIVQSGLQGVVKNPEVPGGRMRCGMVEYGQGCVLYLVNAKRTEVPVKSMYQLAAQMTSTRLYAIESGNLLYSNTTIKPGYIAQINIPPVK